MCFTDYSTLEIQFGEDGVFTCPLTDGKSLKNIQIVCRILDSPTLLVSDYMRYVKHI